MSPSRSATNGPSGVRRSLPVLAMPEAGDADEVGGGRLQRLDQADQRVQPFAGGHEIGVLFKQRPFRQRGRVAADQQHRLLRRRFP